MGTTQHKEAASLLPIIYSATEKNELLTYRTAAARIGRNPKTNSRMVAQVCDLLDAAAALAGVPLLALVAVRDHTFNINRRAWADDLHRDAIIDKSLNHKFDLTDFEAISRVLHQLEGKGNRAAWKFVRETIPDQDLYRSLSEPEPLPSFDAIDDIGTDTPSAINISVRRYSRDRRIRESVKRRAKGNCEFCGEPGFKCVDGTQYLECHHIIALANEGEDRMTNVIALCPKDHREAHFGERRADIEKQMIKKIAGAGAYKGDIAC